MLTRARWPYPRIVAHRAGGSVAPENTLVGLRAAAGLGFAGIEVDARLAALKGGTTGSTGSTGGTGGAPTGNA